MSFRSIENGFEVRYLSDQDGDRYVTIHPDAADMTGWRVEVGVDEDWRGHRDGITDHERRTVIEEFRRRSYFGMSYQPWCAMVDWGRTIVRWLPPGEE